MFLIVFLFSMAVFGLVIGKDVMFLIHARRCTELLSGTVTSLEEKVFLNANSHRSTFIPTVRYEYGGKTYHAEAAHSYYYDEHTVDTAVWVYVNPSAPAHMILSRERSDAARSIVTAAILLAVVGVFCGWKSWMLAS